MISPATPLALQVGQVRRQVTFGRFSSVMAAAACYARMCGRAAAMARQDEEESLAGREAVAARKCRRPSIVLIRFNLVFNCFSVNCE